MPGRDGTGPLGAGAMTGRSLGSCAGSNSQNKSLRLRIGSRLFYKRRFKTGLGKGAAANRFQSESQKKF